jgi:hypothetical protein
MRRPLKVKAPSAHAPLRKAATSGSAVSRRNFPAWIDASDGDAFSTNTVTPRVRDALVLRKVTRKPAQTGGTSGGRTVR